MERRRRPSIELRSQPAYQPLGVATERLAARLINLPIEVLGALAAEAVVHSSVLTRKAEELLGMHVPMPQQADVIFSSPDLVSSLLAPFTIEEGAIAAVNKLWRRVWQTRKTQCTLRGPAPASLPSELVGACIYDLAPTAEGLLYVSTDAGGVHVLDRHLQHVHMIHGLRSARELVVGEHGLYAWDSDIDARTIRLFEIEWDDDMDQVCAVQLAAGAVDDGFQILRAAIASGGLLYLLTSIEATPVQADDSGAEVTPTTSYEILAMNPTTLQVCHRFGSKLFRHRRDATDEVHSLHRTLPLALVFPSRLPHPAPLAFRS